MTDIVAYIDQNNVGGAGYCMKQLNETMEQRIDGITTTTNVDEADIVHLNDLNIWAGIFHGKESLRSHFRNFLQYVFIESDTPVAVTEHGSIHFSEARQYAFGSQYNIGGLLSAFVRQTERTIASRSDAIFAISNSVHQQLVRGGIDEEKIHVTYHSVDDRYTNRYETAEEKFVFHLSHYSPRKNPSAIVETARRLDEQFVIAGRNWKENGPDEIHTLDNVDVLGYVDEEELIRLYNRAAVFYFPSTHEGFGLPVLEAMSCGTPVVGSNAYAVPEVVGEGGILWPPDDVDAHVKSIRSLLEDDARRNRFEMKALEQSKKFSWERTAEKVANVYREIHQK